MKAIGTIGLELRSRLGTALCIISAVLMLVPSGSVLWAQTTYPGMIGINVADRPQAFVDVQKDGGRLFHDGSGNPVPYDANGWPTTDGIATIIDDRPVPAWTGTIDDPEEYQPDMAGTYVMSFQGQATLSNVSGNPTLTFANQSYDSSTNTTTVDVTMPGGATYADGPALMVISFTNTQRTATSGTNTGITDLQVLRPNMPSAAYNQVFGQAGLNPNGQIFDPAFLRALAPFAYLRFVNWTNADFNPGYYGDTGHHLINWADCSLPTDEKQGIGTSIRAGAEGISWEYVILLANAANKDIWINIPISATGGSDSLDPTYDPSTNSYIYQLALLLKNGDAFTGNKGLNPGLHIYIEHSNEVWNTHFLQYTWNKLAAEDEVSKGGSTLNNDGDTNQEHWAQRRNIKRLYEIAQIFQQVFGESSLNTTIRPVYAWWQLQEGSGSSGANALAWFASTYGQPSDYFYALALGDYFYGTNYANDTTISEVLSDMETTSNNNVTYAQKAKATADQYGLKLFAYEGGPDNSKSGTTNIGVQIEANRDPGMGILVEELIGSNFFDQGGDSFDFYDLSSSYSRFGSWGATDDYRNLSTAKYNALVSLLGAAGQLAYEPFGETTGILNGASGGGDFGWGAGWSVQNNSTDVPGYNVVSTSPLSYSSLLASGGNYVIGGDNYLAAGRALDVTTNGPFSSYLSGSLIGASGKTIWVSFLFRKDANDTVNDFIALNNTSTAWQINHTNDIRIGYFGTTSQSGGVNYWSLQQVGGNTVLSNVPVAIGQTTLMVVEITFGSTNTVNLYVNPTSLGGSAPNTPNATLSTANSVAFRSIAYLGGHPNNESSLDDIRIGTSFAAVTPTH